MIDIHVHLRDGELAYKETIAHGGSLAAIAGFSAVFDMPNTTPPLTSRENIVARLKLAEQSLREVNLFYGVYAGITLNPVQIEEAVNCFNEFFPKVVGLKMFAGHSTGNMGITEKNEQAIVYETLSKLKYKGVLAIHCEKESLMDSSVFNLEEPETHSLARPNIAEVESVKDQIELAKHYGFQGHIHICHISTKEAVQLVVEAKKQGMNISSGATAHHSLLNTESYSYLGLHGKMNPPLRSEEDRAAIFSGLISGDIDWIESDHAPHTLGEKKKGASGIPGFAGMLLLIEKLRKEKCSESRLKEICGEAVNKTFGLNLPVQIPSSKEIEAILPKLRGGYPFDAFAQIEFNLP